MFKVTKTDNGFCCSFNTISVSEGFAKAPEDTSEDDEPAEYDYAFYDPDFGFFDPAAAPPFMDPYGDEGDGKGPLDGEVGGVGSDGDDVGDDAGEDAGEDAGDDDPNTAPLNAPGEISQIIDAHESW